MHAAKDKVHTKIGEEHTQEGEKHEEMEKFWSPERRKQSRMQGKGIDEQRDQCPHFLRIPSPIATPRDIGPDSSDEYSRCEKKNGRMEQQMI